jgi:hypothetical protein
MKKINKWIKPLLDSNSISTYQQSTCWSIELLGCVIIYEFNTHNVHDIVDSHIFSNGWNIIIPPQRNGWGCYTCPSVRASVRRLCSIFRTFFGLILQILKWNLIWLFTIMSYRSRLSFAVFD